MLDFSHLKLVVYDEADQLLLEENNKKAFDALRRDLKKKNADPQQVLFSATFSEEIKEKMQAQVGNLTCYFLKDAALKLEGVQHFQI